MGCTPESDGILRKEFHCDGWVELGILVFVRYAHAAFAELLENVIL